MDNTDGSYIDDRTITVFYQLLGVAPQVAATMYEPTMNEGVRVWLNDVYEAAPDKQTQRWLHALYLYYGLVTGDPMSYQEIGTELEVSGEAVRKAVARGLRYLWFLTHAETEERGFLQRLMEKALVANEWVTCNPSDTISFSEWMALGAPWSVEGLTEPAAMAGDGGVPGAKQHQRVDLWDPEYAHELWPDLDETRVVFKRRGDLVKPQA
jgi:hypothetical protein